MAEVTRLLDAAAAGDPKAAAELLPLVYDELRKLAAVRMASEAPGQTLQPTALVHEAYLRLVGDGADVRWNGRGHFFAAAAEAMRRILVENARRHQTVKRGGGANRREVSEGDLITEPGDPISLLALDEALAKLAADEPDLARLVELRYFTGLGVEEAAEVLGISPRTAKREWSYARAWLRRELDRE